MQGELGRERVQRERKIRKRQREENLDRQTDKLRKRRTESESDRKRKIERKIITKMECIMNRRYKIEKGRKSKQRENI